MRRNSDHRIRVERLLLAIGIYGPSVIYQHVRDLTDLYHNERTSFMEVQAYLEERGMSRDDVWRLVNATKHPDDCACWTCVGRLQLQIIRSRAEREVAAEQTSMEAA